MSSRPVPRRPTAALLVTVLALLIGVLLVVFFVRLSNQPGSKINVGSEQFDVGKATTFAPRIAQAGPLLLPALRGSQQDIFLQHLGADPNQGWLAFDAHAPDEGRTCLLRWRQSSRDFADPCSTRVFPADGAGLNQYAVRVDQRGHVLVDLRQTLGTVPPVTAPPGP
jgi:hypothetical protein